MRRDEFEELLGAYAVDACDPAEEAAIAQHLVDCPRCRAELAAHEEVAGVLGNLGGEAPAGLWARIWTEIASPDRRDDASEGEGAGETGLPRYLAHPPPPFAVLEGQSADRDGAPDETGGASVPSQAVQRADRRWGYAIVAGAVAAALAVVVGLLGTTVGNLDNQVSALNKAVVTGGVRGAEQAAVADPSHRAVQLESTTGPWRAQLVTLPSGTAFIVPEKMPSIAPSRTFQAWAIVHGKIVSLGVLGRSGRVQQLLLEPNMTAVLVNTEPLGGTSQPTTPVLPGEPADDAVTSLHVVSPERTGYVPPVPDLSKQARSTNTGQVSPGHSAEEIAPQVLEHVGRHPEGLHVDSLVVTVEHRRELSEAQPVGEHAEPVGDTAETPEETGVCRSHDEERNEGGIRMKVARHVGEGVPQRGRNRRCRRGVVEGKDHLHLGHQIAEHLGDGSPYRRLVLAGQRADVEVEIDGVGDHVDLRAPVDDRRGDREMRASMRCRAIPRSGITARKASIRPGSRRTEEISSGQPIPSTKRRQASWICASGR